MFLRLIKSKAVINTALPEAATTQRKERQKISPKGNTFLWFLRY